MASKNRAPFDQTGAKADAIGLDINKTLGSDTGDKQRRLGPLSRFLAFIAGADIEVLKDCPDSDRKYINQLGLSLLLSGSILFFISFGAIVASGIATGATQITIFAFVCALLVLIVMSIDRSFIMSDWFSEADSQLAGQTIGARSRRAGVRGFAFLVRIVLSVSIAFVFSVLAETYIYRESVNKLIEEEHLAQNQGIYAQLDVFRAEQEAALNAKRAQIAVQEKFSAETTQRFVDLSTNRPGETTQVTSLNTQIAEFDQAIARANADIDAQKAEFKRQSDIAIAETAGEAGPGLTARAGCGPACRAALSRAELAEAEISRLTAQIADLGAQRDSLFTEAKQTSSATQAQYDALLASVRAERDQADAKLAQLRTELVAAEQAYEQVIEDRVSFVQTQPGFVPKATGLAKRFSVLKQVYEQNQIWLEVIGLKLFIMMVEMAPILIKFASSPKTQYAVKLNKAVYLKNFEDETHRLQAASQFMEQSLRYAQQAELFRQQAPNAKRKKAKKVTAPVPPKVDPPSIAQPKSDLVAERTETPKKPSEPAAPDLNQGAQNGHPKNVLPQFTPSQTVSLRNVAPPPKAPQNPRPPQNNMPDSAPLIGPTQSGRPQAGTSQLDKDIEAALGKTLREKPTSTL